VNTHAKKNLKLTKW